MSSWRNVLFVAAVLGFQLSGQNSQFSTDIDPSAGEFQRLRRADSAQRMVSAFNFVGTHAAELKGLMSQKDAIFFDERMLDIMGALVAMPGIAVKTWENPDTIKPERPRPDRFDQLPAAVAALDTLLTRLLATSRNPAERKLLDTARQSVVRMSAVLPKVIPTVAAKPNRE